MGKSFIKLPTRTTKPRQNGITMVIDSFLGTNGMQDLVETGSEFIDYVKLGWGTALINPILEKKVKFYKDNNIKVCLGGTFFEVAYVNNKVDDFASFVSDLNIELVEISDGTVEIPRNEKLKHIEQFSKKFTVLSEYGSKDNTVEIKAPNLWVQNMKEELQAGAWKVVAEGRESGTAGLYRPSTELRTGLVDEIVDSIPLEQILWEAPKKSHQTWFIKKYGANVNLGNIAPKDIIPLRLGLRSDTLQTFHPS